ncbi:DUF58 domain-containing protein [Halobacillus rhizosphaerae]|uniref:DUF58 domain-containing protein n=1 Tax=Halobacillus rhizosphaerae TaxID=3064889 RepID=UPI00398AC9D0
MTKSFKTLWARFLFRDNGILPARRLIGALMMVSIFILLLALFGVGWVYIILIDGSLLAVSLLDLGGSPKKSELEFNRRVKEEVERGLEYESEITIKNHSLKSGVFQLVDDLPPVFDRPFPISGKLSPRKEACLRYTFTAHVRGDYRLEGVYIRYQSRLGLWSKQMKVDLPVDFQVIPDLTSSRHYLEDAQKFLLYEGDQRKKQKIGSGEFAKIRSYVVGDDLRKINWRQSAKLQELMTNEYEPEHGKYVTILLDCGRMMGVELQEGNRLERTLEAAITVATAALKRGDYVSLLAFSKEIMGYVPPAKGMAHLQTILKEVYSLQVDSYESNYSEVFHYLQTIQKKRTLILLFSDVSTFLYEEAPLYYLQRLRRRHVFLLAGMQDKMIEERTALEPENIKTAMLKSMAERHILVKNREIQKWERQGLQMLEVPEEELAGSVVSSYISMMNRGMV